MDRKRREFLELGGLAFLGMTGIGEAAVGKGMFVHVVFFKFKPEVAEDEIAGFMKDLADVKKKIPVLKEFLVGKNTSKNGRVYHYAQVSVFEKKEDLAIYEKHPEHEKLAQRIRPAIAGGIAMDFEPL